MKLTKPMLLLYRVWAFSFYRLTLIQKFRTDNIAYQRIHSITMASLLYNMEACNT